MIDFNLLNESIKHYEMNGFIRIETPWTVSEYVDNLTKPVHIPSYQLKHNNKCLVASGEQSFLYLYLKGYLPKGKYQTITPCFRSDDFDFLHTKTFMKNELIITDVVNEENLMNVINTSFTFFEALFNQKIDVVKTESGYDVEISGYELGSYGIRECEFLKWIYGTGCAEPRTSSLLNYIKNGISLKENR